MKNFLILLVVFLGYLCLVSNAIETIKFGAPFNSKPVIMINCNGDSANYKYSNCSSQFFGLHSKKDDLTRAALEAISNWLSFKGNINQEEQFTIFDGPIFPSKSDQFFVSVKEPEQPKLFRNSTIFEETMCFPN